MINPKKALELKQQKDAFEKRHPKFFPFVKAVGGDSLCEGSVVELTVTPPGGKPMTTNLRLTKEDILLLQQLKMMK